MQFRFCCNVVFFRFYFQDHDQDPSWYDDRIPYPEISIAMVTHFAVCLCEPKKSNNQVTKKNEASKKDMNMFGFQLFGLKCITTFLNKDSTLERSERC